MEAARKDSAVHVSLSSDSLFKQPGSRVAPNLRSAGDVNSRRSRLASDELIGSWVTLKSEVLRQARHHAEAVRRAEWGVYIRGPNSCQHDYT